jgi:hypothetical protein
VVWSPLIYQTFPTIAERSALPKQGSQPYEAMACAMNGLHFLMPPIGTIEVVQHEKNDRIDWLFWT